MKSSKRMGRKDKISQSCSHCHHEYTIAYWDYELSSYIYLDDEPYACHDCRTDTEKDELPIAA